MGRRIVSREKAPSMVPAFKFPNQLGYLPLTIKEMTDYAVSHGIIPDERDEESFGKLIQGYIKSVYTDYIDKCNGDKEDEAKLREYIAETEFPIYLVPEKIFGNGLVY